MDQGQTNILLSLRHIATELSRQDSFEKAIESLVKNIAEAIHVDCCSLYLYHDERKIMRLSATEGLAKNAVGKVSMELNEGLVGFVAKNKEVVNLAEATEHPAFKYLPDVGEDEFHSFLGVPVINQGQLLGVLVVQCKESRQFSQIEESFLVTLSSQIATIIGQKKEHSLNKHKDSKIIQAQISTGEYAIAKAYVWRPAISYDDLKVIHCPEPALQVELFHQTMFQMQIQMDRATLKMQEAHKTDAAFGYMSGYGNLLDDASFAFDVVQTIEQQGVLATSAVKIVIDKKIEQLKKDKQDHLLLDLKDFAQILTSRLLHTTGRDFDFKDEVILVCKSIPAALIAEMPKDKVVGFVTTSSATSAHAVLLAKALQIPALIGANVDLNFIDGHNLVIDGVNNCLLIDPQVSVVDEFLQLININKEKNDLFAKEKLKEPITLDNKLIQVQVNAGISTEEDGEELLEQTDGIGLYRTEIAYMLEPSFPTENQLTQWYSQVLSRFKSKVVTMRTLDIGSDKELSYFPIRETNPAFGFRGVRVTLDQLQIFMTQLRAMISAHQKYGNMEIMIPMVSRVDEIVLSKKTLVEAAQEVGKRTGSEVVSLPKFGIMIEVPSIVYLLDDFLNDVDFISVGSNDLIQYLLAVDKSNSKVSRYFNPFHPAVLRCLYYINKKANEYKKPCSICGELAASPLGLIMLLSLGYSKVSMNYSGIQRAKYIIRRVSISELLEVGQRALKLSDSLKIMDLYSEYARSHGLGKIIDETDQTVYVK